MKKLIISTASLVALGLCSTSFAASVKCPTAQEYYVCSHGGQCPAGFQASPPSSEELPKLYAPDSMSYTTDSSGKPTGEGAISCHYPYNDPYLNQQYGGVSFDYTGEVKSISQSNGTWTSKSPVGGLTKHTCLTRKNNLNCTLNVE